MACSPYCGFRTRAFANTCLPCNSTENCNWSLNITPARLNSTTILVKIKPSMKAILMKENLPKIFTVYVEGFGYIRPIYQSISDNQFLMILPLQGPFYNRILNIFAASTKTSGFAQTNGNYLQASKTNYTLFALRDTSDFSYKLATTLASSFSYLQGTIIFLAIFHFFFSISSSLTCTILTKQLLLSFQNLQLTGLLIYLSCIYPSDLHAFLFRTYSAVIGINQGLAHVPPETVPPHPNFFDYELIPNFTFNTGVTLLIFAILATLSFVFYILYSFRESYATPTKELFERIRRAIEFSLPISLLMAFDYQMFFFALIQFK